MDGRAGVVARFRLPDDDGHFMGSSVTTDLDAATLQRCLRLGGLDVDIDRASTLLPMVAALLAGCDRLAALDLSCAGGCGPDGGRGD